MDTTFKKAIDALHKEQLKGADSGHPDYEALYMLALQAYDAATEALERQEKVMGWMAEILATRGQQNDRLREMIWNLERAAQHGYTVEEVEETIQVLGKVKPGYEIF